MPSPFVCHHNLARQACAVGGSQAVSQVDVTCRAYAECMSPRKHVSMTSVGLEMLGPPRALRTQRVLHGHGSGAPQLKVDPPPEVQLQACVCALIFSNLCMTPDIATYTMLLHFTRYGIVRSTLLYMALQRALTEYCLCVNNIVSKA